MKTKTMKRVLTFIAAMTICAAMAVPAMTASAADGGTVVISSSNSSLDVRNKTYDVYKMFDLVTNGNAKLYTVTDEWYPFFAAQYNDAQTNKDAGKSIPTALSDTDTNANTAAKQAIAEWFGNLGVTDTDEAPVNESSALRKLAQAAQKAVMDNPDTYANTKQTVTPAKGADTTQTLTYTLAQGYYLFVDSTTTDAAKSAPMLQNVIDNVANSVELKTDAPSIEKKIHEGDAYVDSNSAGYKEEVEYRVQTNIPDTQYYEKYTYVITDTLSNGLDLVCATTTQYGDSDYYLVTSGITVSVENCTDVAPHNEHDLNWTAYYDATTRKLKIVFDSDNMQDLGDAWEHAGDKITVTYKATVNADAKIGEDGNLNEVDLTYSNDPSQSGKGYKDDGDEPGEPDDSTKTTEKDMTLTYLSEFRIKKTDGTNILTGAEFEITDTEGNPVAVLVGVTNYYAYTNDTEKITITKAQYDTFNADGSGETGWTKVEMVTEYVAQDGSEVKAYVDDEGYIVFSGLAAGTYRITETTAPAGYNKLTDTIDVTLTCKDAAGEDDITSQEVKTGSEKATWSASAKFTNGDVITVDTNGVFTITVVNKTGGLFPSTGGIGTTIFYTVGLGMILGASALLVVKRKQNAQ